MTYDKTVTDKGTGDRGIFERAAMYMPGLQRVQGPVTSAGRWIRRSGPRSSKTIKNFGEALANVQGVVRFRRDIGLAKDIGQDTRQG